MAKVRRVIRKVDPVRKFDDQIWPVYLALILFGGFLWGVVLAYLRFGDPRWYANAITGMLAVPVLIGAFIGLLYFIDNKRRIRRPMQLAIVLSLLVNVILVVSMDREVFSRAWETLVYEQAESQREPVVIPEYTPQRVNPQEQQQQDFNRPLETETPDEIVPETIEREKTPTEQTPEQPQMIPVPEPERTQQPNITRKQQEDLSTPRQSEQQSRMSRQQLANRPRPNQPVATPTDATQRAQRSTMQPQETQVTRQSTQQQSQRREVDQQPTTAQPNAAAQIARRTDTPTTEPRTTSTPTLDRSVARPAVTPRTQVDMPADPSVARRTQENTLQPANTEVRQQATTSPQVEHAPSRPNPQTPSVVRSQTVARQSQADPRPTVAQSNRPVPNQRTRTTSRPEIATTASETNSQARPTQQTSQLQASNTTVQRQNTPSHVQRAATPTQPTRTPTPQQTAQVSRTPTQSAPTVSSATPSPSRSVARSQPQSQPSPTQTTNATQVQSTAQRPEQAAISPTSVAVSRQATSSPQAAPRMDSPSPRTTSQPSPNATARATGRRAQSQETPSTSTADSQSASRTSNSRRAPNIQTNVANVATNMSPSTSSDPTPRPSASSVARQTNSSPTATRAQPSATQQSASPTTQIARTSSQRATASDVATINPRAAANRSPARASRSANRAVSPTAVDSPAVAQSSTNSSRPNPDPSRMSISRARTGVAGQGEAMNLDSATPAANSPAMVASGSARRAEATQNTPQGSALSPSAPALVARARAGAQRPSSMLQAQPVEVATASGAQQPSDLNASATAAVTKANADATQSDVTAAAGNVTVDLGPTQVVSANSTGRAGGGGQPEINPNSQSRQVARSESGGAPQVSLQVNDVAEVAAAPDGDGGGTPDASMPDPTAVAMTRTEAGGGEPVSGGPSAALESGPTAEMSTTELLATTQRSRADSAEAAASASSADGGIEDLEDEEEKARRLARQSVGGAPQVAMAAAVVAPNPGAPTTTKNETSGAESALAASVAASSLPRANTDAGTSAATGPASAAPVSPSEGASGSGQVAAANMRRAETSDAAEGTPLAGGGSSSPQRNSQGPQFTANTQAEAVAMAGEPASGGEHNGVPLEATGVVAARETGGLRAPTEAGPVGAAAGKAPMAAPEVGQVGTASGARQSSPSQDEGIAVASTNNSGAPLKRSRETGLPGGSAAEMVVAIPQMGPAGESEPSMADLGGDLEIGPMARQSTAALAVNIDAFEGTGGLGSEYQPDVGLTTRQASQESPEVHVRQVRFLKQNSAGIPSVSTNVIAATNSFMARSARVPNNTNSDGSGPVGPETEEAIERGLKFLASTQKEDGRWTLAGFGEEVALRSDTAATGLSLLAFQGAGYNHRQFKYKEQVLKAVNFLVKNQNDDGDLFVAEDDLSNKAVRLYSHGIATIALCEAYGMTQDPALREPAQKAIDFIVASQHETRGGWRYSPGVSSDTSVSGWMMMALKSGELATLKVPPDTYEKIESWLNLSQGSDNERHLYRYNPYAPDTDEQRHGRQPSKTMTSVGLLMRLYGGWERKHESMVAGADYLLGHLPTNGTTRNPQRDTYYWYYATQVMCHMDGEHWKKWNAALHPALVDTQVTNGVLAGSWHPRSPVPDRWAFHGGRLYVTTLNLLSLEVQYRKLPLTKTFTQPRE